MYLTLSVETSDVGAGVVTDRQTDRQTHRHTDKTSTVTLLRMRAEGYNVMVNVRVCLRAFEATA